MEAVAFVNCTTFKQLLEFCLRVCVCVFERGSGLFFFTLTSLERSFWDSLNSQASLERGGVRTAADIDLKGSKVSSETDGPACSNNYEADVEY